MREIISKLIYRLMFIYREYSELIHYLFFGVCSTVVNIVAYYVLYHQCKISNVVSTVLAWFIAVAFSFIVNKVFVFKSSRKKKYEEFRELILFFISRFMTGLFDVVIMAVAVDVMQWNSLIWKIISNIIIAIINYITGKYIVFNDQ